MDEPSWTDRRQHSARVRADLAAAKRQLESEQAQQLIDQFVTRVLRDGPPAQDIKARTTGGRLVRTNIRGWYIKADHSVAISTDGGYYQLIVFDSFAAWLRGVHLMASPPPLVVGYGGKDGETGDLKDFLDKVL